VKVSQQTSKNRILMLLENLPFPQDLRVRREAYALTSASYRVTVICPSKKGQPSREIVNGVAVYRYPAPLSAHGFVSYLWEYAYSMAASFCLSLAVAFREGFDVVHAHNPPDTFVFIAMFYKLFGKRFVYDHHDLSPEMYVARFHRGGRPMVHHALVLFEKLSCLFADHVIVTNESYKKVAMERGRVPEEQITIVRNGIELSRAMIPVEPDQELRQMGKTIIGYVGVMGVQDGVDYLLRALNHLLRGLHRNDFYCVIIGFGDALEDLKRIAQELALQDHVRFTGPIFGEGLRRLLAAADICVDSSPANPYTDRSTMFKIMEYMALGKPIVAFDLPEHRFTARGAAVYATPNDERAFARALAQLMDDPDRRMVLGTAGSGRIKTQLAWEYSIPNLLSVYRTVLPEAKIPQAAAAPEAEVLGKPEYLRAMPSVQVSQGAEADQNPRATQPNEVFSPTGESAASRV
jgi:glycosyltransferase involved in cell wall biosynthesis